MFRRVDILADSVCSYIFCDVGCYAFLVEVSLEKVCSFIAALMACKWVVVMDLKKLVY